MNHQVEHSKEAADETFKEEQKNRLESIIAEFQKSGKPIKFNLGCGDKLLKDFINVDIAMSRKGLKPDVISDIRNLPLIPDGCADEVLSVHVIEHFYYWEAFEILKEWKRILKPTGKLVLECPNLEYAARQLLKDPEKYSRPDKDGQQTMWVFYGDPQWKDPYMCHKWGYTPKSLIKLLKDLEFSSLKQEPAMYKQKEPRDMRITGLNKKPFSFF